MLDVRRLRMLRELSLHGTIRAAASSLSFTPSAVSQQLSALERDLGVELLERRGRSVQLTPAAQLLVERTERILVELAAAEAEAKAVATGTEPALRIASFASAAATIVAAALANDAMRRAGSVPVATALASASAAASSTRMRSVRSTRSWAAGVS